MTRPYSEESAYAHKLIGDPNHAELSRYLDTVGDGSGSNIMNIAAPTTFRIKPPDGQIFLIDEIRIAGWDNAPASGGSFIGIAALTIGCKLEIREKPGDSAEIVIQDLTDGEPLKQNACMMCLGDTDIDNLTGQSMVQCSIKPGGPYRLEGKRGESLVFQTQDDLSGILGLRVRAIGRIYDNGGLG